MQYRGYEYSVTKLTTFNGTILFVYAIEGMTIGSHFTAEESEQCAKNQIDQFIIEDEAEEA
jgi:hypothetical protein